MRSVSPQNSSFEVAREAATGEDEELDCVAVGISVECFIPDSDSETDAEAEAGVDVSSPESRSSSMAGDTSETVPLIQTQALPNSVQIKSNGSALIQNGSSLSEDYSLLEKQAPESGDPSSFTTESTVAGEWTTLTNLLDTLILISPFFFWGTSMVVMKDLLPKTGSMFVASVRLIPSGILLVLFAQLTNRKSPETLLAWFSILVFGFIDAACFQGFLTEGLEKTNAGLGSVIIDSQPLTVAILSSIIFGEKIGPLGALGLILGVIGLLLLEVPYEFFSSFFTFENLNSFEHFFSGDVTASNFSLLDKGEFWMLLAAQSMAIGTILVRWVCKYNDPIMATGWHMILGGLPLLYLSYQQGDPIFSSNFSGLNTIDYASFFYASIFGSAISYGVFFYNANKGNLTQLSSLTFLTPMFAATFGFLFLGETLTPFQLFGATVTLASIYLVNSKPKE